MMMMYLLLGAVVLFFLRNLFGESAAGKAEKRAVAQHVKSLQDQMKRFLRDTHPL